MESVKTHPPWYWNHVSKAPIVGSGSCESLGLGISMTVLLGIKSWQFSLELHRKDPDTGNGSLVPPGRAPDILAEAFLGATGLGHHSKRILRPRRAWIKSQLSFHYLRPGKCGCAFDSIKRKKK